MLAITFMLIPRASVSAKRINEVLDSKDNIIDGTFDDTTDEIGTISFKDVSFKYPDADDYILKNISFDVKKGETVAFIGSTGCGKSTVVNLIPRFYDATSGSVLVDVVDVKDFSQYELRDRIGFVPQKGVLFSGSIKDNIDFAVKNVSDEVIEKSAKIAQASDFIDAKENKYDYRINVFPEAYASLIGLTSRGKLSSGMSINADIGGGTTDISFFIVKDRSLMVSLEP